MLLMILNAFMFSYMLSTHFANAIIQISDCYFYRVYIKCKSIIIINVILVNLKQTFKQYSKLCTIVHKCIYNTNCKNEMSLK